MSASKGNLTSVRSCGMRKNCPSILSESKLKYSGTALFCDTDSCITGILRDVSFKEITSPTFSL